MSRQHPHITYIVVDPNENSDLKKAIKEAIIEKLLLIHMDALKTIN